MGEQSLRACPKTKEERDIEAPFDLNEGGSLAEANSKSTGGRSSDLVQGQASSYDKVVNLDLTLAQPIDYTRFDRCGSGSLAAFGTNQVTGEADSKSTVRSRLNFVQGQPSPIGEAVNIDLTLA
ncbi:Uncharacterized protein TCM_002129 [Theobroma cacao]|uniref:Uncharacterized protein n=1 Tax=Theobroma cacao TaxID=3641 RepID=A0A061DMI2_THECC|nr:Uncharacterized protein TCM_002129 [Theobroma cacao]